MKQHQYAVTFNAEDEIQVHFLGEHRHFTLCGGKFSGIVSFPGNPDTISKVVNALETDFCDRCEATWTRIPEADRQTLIHEGLLEGATK
jgi:hypothetical protein